MRPFRFVLALGVLLSGIAAANNPNYDEPRSRYDRAGYFFAKGEQAFKRGQLESARYRWDISAYWANKLAQYNLGLMYFKGVGVPMDRARGVAFLAVASERGDLPLKDALEWAHAQLTPEEVDRANKLWREEIKPRYADEFAMVRAESLFRMDVGMTTGSHTGHTIGRLEVYSGDRGEWEDGMNRQRDLLRQGVPALHPLFPKVEIGDMVPLETKPGGQ